MKDNKLKNLFNLVSIDGISSDCAFDIYNSIAKYEKGGIFSLVNFIAENKITKASEIPSEELLGVFEKVWSINESVISPNFKKSLDFMITTALNYCNFCSAVITASAHSNSLSVRSTINCISNETRAMNGFVTLPKLESVVPGITEGVKEYFKGVEYPNLDAPGIAVSLVSSFDIMATYYSSNELVSVGFGDININGKIIGGLALSELMDGIFNGEVIIDFSKYNIEREELAEVACEIVRDYAIVGDVPNNLIKIAMHDLVLKPGTYLSEAAKSLNGILLKEFDKFDECRKPNPHTSDFEGDSVDFRYSFAHYFPGTVPSHLSVSKASPVAESDVGVDNSRQEAKEMTNGEAAEFLNELFINNRTLEKPVKLTSAAIMMLFNVTGVKVAIGYDLVWSPTPKLYRTLRMSWLLN